MAEGTELLRQLRASMEMLERVINYIPICTMNLSLTIEDQIYMCTVHEQIGHNAKKCENIVFLQHQNSGTTMSPELILGVAVPDRSIRRSKRKAYRCYRS